MANSEPIYIEDGAVRFSPPVAWRNHAHVLWSSSCTNRGYATWGWRLECLGCGEVNLSSVGSSVAHEDAPGRFAWDHRDCAKG